MTEIEIHLYLLMGISKYHCDTWLIRTSRREFFLGDAIKAVKEHVDPQVDERVSHFELVRIEPKLALDADRTSSTVIFERW